MARTMVNFGSQEDKKTMLGREVPGRGGGTAKDRPEKKEVGQSISSMFCVKASQAEGDAFTQNMACARLWGFNGLSCRASPGAGVSGFRFLGRRFSGFRFQGLGKQGDTNN